MQITLPVQLRTTPRRRMRVGAEVLLQATAVLFWGKDLPVPTRQEAWRAVLP
jgi:hypothetical protein